MEHGLRDDNAEAPWEFDTVRGRSDGATLGDGALSLPVPSADDSSLNPTIRPNKSKVPPTLRMLFEDDSVEMTQADFEATFSHLTPATPVAGIPSRARGRSRSNAALEPAQEALTARQPTFVFPPRASSPRTEGNSLLTEEPESELDKGLTIQTTWPSLSEENDADVPVGMMRSGPLAEGAMRSNFADKEAFEAPLQLPDTHAPISSSPKSFPSAQPPIQTPPIRRRVQSNTADATAPLVLRPTKEPNLTSSIDFHFPPLSAGIPRGPPIPAPLKLTLGDPVNLSTTPLDGPKRMPSPFAFGSSQARPAATEHDAPSTPHSAVLTSTQIAIARRPSLSRLTSLGGKEVTMHPSPTTPNRNRDEKDFHDLPAMPGLKDVLKVRLPEAARDHVLTEILDTLCDIRA